MRTPSSLIFSAGSLVLGLLLIAACDRGGSDKPEDSRSTAAANPVAPDESDVPGAAGDPTELADTGVQVSEPPSREALRESICGDTKLCHITAVKDAGSDGATRLQAVEVAYVKDPDSDFKSAEMDDCNTWALFVARADGGAVTSTRKIVEFCNDGYGASGVGEDQWSVEGTQLSVGTYGGSNWRWDRGTTVDLATMNVVEVAAGSFFSSTPGVESNETWNFERFEGTSSWTGPECGESEEGTTWSASLIPAVEVSDSFDWKMHDLGDCASVIDGKEHEGAQRGYVIHGEGVAPADASMKLVVSKGGTLYVEVTDDKLVSGETSWIHGDHLELWASPDEPMKMEFECIDPEDRRVAWQWGIDAVDGAVYPAHGKPSTELKAERVSIAGGVRFKVELPADAKSFTVVYSDSDDGTSQERLLATSQLEFGRVQSFGALEQIEPDRATCGLQGSSLAVELRPLEGLAPH